MRFDILFSMITEYTMEHQGVLGFLESLSDVYPNPKMGRWFVPGSRHYSWDKVRSLQVCNLAEGCPFSNNRYWKFHHNTSFILKLKKS